jgi:M-phase inducer tyrosine phosphatase
VYSSLCSAKHLRAKDRAANHHCYPKIHYPEVYILEGGYCQYFKECPTQCDPPAYVRMDDPTHAVSRKEDLDRFRRNKFGRTQSYAYGEGAGAAKLLSAVTRTDREPRERPDAKRNTAPGGGMPAMFAAGNAARTRRGPTAVPAPIRRANTGLGALAEDGDATAGEEDDTDIGDSPCPPPTKSSGLGFKVKKIGRAPLLRAETCGPIRLGGY